MWVIFDSCIAHNIFLGVCPNMSQVHMYLPLRHMRTFVEFAQPSPLEGITHLYSRTRLESRVRQQSRRELLGHRLLAVCSRKEAF